MAANSSSSTILVWNGSLQLLFEMVAKRSLVAFLNVMQDDLLPFYRKQLHRHAMQ